jgi:hypothetical protein
MHATKKNAEAHVVCVKEVVLELNTEKYVHVFGVSRRDHRKKSQY